MKSTLLIAGLLLAGAAGSLAAVPGVEHERPILSSRWGLQMGGFLVDLDTNVAAGYRGFLGTVVSLEEVLDLEENQNTLRVDAFFRIKAKHSLDFNVLRIRREASAVIEDPLDFDEISFLGSVESRFDMDQFRMAYRYSFINTGRVDAGIAGGLSWFMLDGYISGDAVVEFPAGTFTPVGAENAGAKLLAPVPTFGIFIDFAPSRWFVMQISADFLDLNAGEIEGRFQDLRLTLDFYFSRNVGIGIGTNSTDLEYRDTGRQPFRIDYRYSGVLFYLSLAF